MANLKFYFLHYNNFFNRVEKKLDTLAEYLEYRVCDPIQDVNNFTVGNGVDTTFIYNKTPNFIGMPDYLIVTDVNSVIIHRWFVMDSEELRNGQWRFQLKRDVIADNYNAVISSKCFIERANVPDSSDMIFNDEGMNFNEIKKKEVLLKDTSDTAWIVGFIPRNLENKTGSVLLKNNYDYAIGGNHDQWSFASYTSNNPLRDRPTATKVTLSFNPNILKHREIYFTKNNWWENLTAVNGNIGYHVYSWTGYSDFIRIFKANPIYNYFNFDQIEQKLENVMGFDYDHNSVNELLSYRNKKISFSDGVYEVKINTRTYDLNEDIEQNDGDICDYLLTTGISYFTTVGGIEASDLSIRPSDGTNVYKVNCKGISYYVELIKCAPSSSTTYTWNIKTTRNHLLDQPYDMFCIAYRNISMGIVGGSRFTQPNNLGMMIANNIVDIVTQENIYDLQLLPYCPFRDAMRGEDKFMDLTNLTENNDFEYIKDGESNNVGAIFFPKSSSFSFNIFLDNPINISNYKVESQCDKLRLCSPNYASVFEFNAAKNNGVRFFEVNCTYLPYVPFIQLNPNWGRMYGHDFNDNRGLICGGEFSLPIVNNAWTTYQLNNKNYEKSFQRQIESLDLQQKWQKVGDVASALSGTASGAAAGAQVGGVYGAIAGGVASGIGGAIDVEANMQLRKDAKDLQFDQFNFQLGNIKALPLTLSKVTAYTINNKYFPFLEFYSCSDNERQALIDKIEYEGMSYMAIGSIAEFINKENAYVKARVIKIESDDYEEDNHMSNAIYDRMSKGVYFN